MAPPAWNVPNLMNNLFRYLKENADNLVIKSCVFHYEMEFIHPFMDGNGRMGKALANNPLDEKKIQSSNICRSKQKSKAVKRNIMKFYLLQIRKELPRNL